MNREEFFARCSPEPNTGCWLWEGSLMTRGYGQARVSGMNIGAHRLGYSLYRGDIPPGIEVFHHCDTPACCNPDHLFLGTHAENMRDMVKKGRRTPPRGERHSRAKLSTEKVARIKASLASGKTQTELAREYGVDQSLISRVARNQRWQHGGGH